MTFRYKKELIIAGISLVLCLSIFAYIKIYYFKSTKVNEPIKNVIEYYNEGTNEIKYQQATTKPIETTTKILTTSVPILEEEIEENNEQIEEYSSIPFEVAPTFEDDGSIIYDGLTLTELTDKLNKSLNGYLMNTGYFFAKNTKDTGMNPYLSVSIVLLETGCKWKCSSLTIRCNNIGGLKGGNSCDGGSYTKYETLDEGINGYLNIIYNNYYLQGLDTAEKMASKYAASPEWSNKVNSYIEEIKNA